MHWLKPFFSGRQSFSYRKEVGGKNDCTQLNILSDLMQTSRKEESIIEKLDSEV
jgi:hypothetical protein